MSLYQPNILMLQQLQEQKEKGWPNLIELIKGMVDFSSNILMDTIIGVTSMKILDQKKKIQLK